MTETENSTPSFDNLPLTVAELHVKIDRLTAMFEQFISSADTKPEIMTVEDVAAMLCKSVSTIYAMTSDHRIPYRKQGNKLYFLRSEINAWLLASVVPKDIPKRKRKPHGNSNANETQPAPECITETDTDGNDTGVVQGLSENHTETALSSRKTNKETPLILLSAGYIQGMAQPFLPCCSQMKSRSPEKENSPRSSVNFTVTGATTATVVTYLARSKMPRILQKR